MQADDQTSPVTMFWRPGCPFCDRLRRDLRRVGLSTVEVNIWANRQAAAVVRAIAHGNETVPTVMVGDIGLVNPSAAAVLDAVRALRPDLVPDDAVSKMADLPRDPRMVAQWVVIGLLVVLSFVAESGGHSTLSWVIDAVAVAVYVGFRVARGRIRI